MLEVHAILHRQRCYENMTEKTGTLSDAYVIISYTLLSKHTNIPTRSVAKHVEKLKQLGFLYVSTNISTNTHSYMIKQSNIVDTCNEICSKRNFIKECQRIRNERT